MSIQFAKHDTNRGEAPFIVLSDDSSDSEGNRDPKKNSELAFRTSKEQDYIDLTGSPPPSSPVDEQVRSGKTPTASNPASLAADNAVYSARSSSSEVARSFDAQRKPTDIHGIQKVPSIVPKAASRHPSMLEPTPVPQCVVTPMSQGEMEKVMTSLLREGSDDHANAVEFLLADNRRARDRATLEASRVTSESRANDLTPLREELMDSRSPLEGLSGSYIFGPSKGESSMGPTGRLRVTPHDQKNPPRILNAAYVTYNSQSTAVPPYVSYTTLNRRVLVADDTQLRYYPYFGDNELGEDSMLDSLFENNPKDLPKLYRRAEKAAGLVHTMRVFLKEVGCTVQMVTHYLTGDLSQMKVWNFPAELKAAMEERARALPEESDDEHESARVPKVGDDFNPQQVSLAARACAAFRKVAGISILHVIRKAAVSAQSIHSSKPPLNAPSSSTTSRLILKANNQNSLETYTSLGCRMCYM
ncbi:MAG: hypothetical protein M1837_002347 [Sclerophora amabilis]|nr:MAG: hypothetical protein M1837_002347 [Sclerophora amabilis]